MRFIFVLFCIFVLNLTAADLETIKQRGYINIGVRSELFPFSRLNQDGTFEGFEVEFAKRLGRELLGDSGVINLVGVNAKERMEYLLNNKIDIAVASFAKTTEREKQIDFSMPYFSMSDAILTHKSNKISSMREIADEKILAVPGTTSYNYLKANHYQLIDCKGAQDCFKRLKNGEAKYYVQMIQMIASFPLIDNNYIIPIKKIGSDHFLSVGVRKNTPELLKKINESIVKFSKEGFFKQAYEDVFDPFYRGTLDKKYFLLDALYDFGF